MCLIAYIKLYFLFKNLMSYIMKVIMTKGFFFLFLCNDNIKLTSCWLISNFRLSSSILVSAANCDCTKFICWIMLQERASLRSNNAATAAFCKTSSCRNLSTRSCLLFSWSCTICAKWSLFLTSLKWNFDFISLNSYPFYIDYIIQTEKKIIIVTDNESKDCTV